MKILLVGGGTGGPVTPLMAVRQAILKQRRDISFLYIGTRSPLERSLIEHEGFPCYSIPSGKWRRYPSWRNLVDLFKIIAGFIVSFVLLRRLKPTVLFAAGSFVSVPVAYAAWLLRIRIVIHQQDVIPSLSNRLIYPLASRVTVSLQKSLKDFYRGSGFFRDTSSNRSKLTYTGNPVRAEIMHGLVAKARTVFHLSPDLPTVLVLGGGSGSTWLNELIEAAKGELSKSFQIIHVTGAGKSKNTTPVRNYHSVEYLTDDLPHALKIADIVVSRAGLSTISELAACRKVSLLIPLPDSPQVHNAIYLAMAQAALLAPQHALTAEVLIRVLRKLLFDQETRKTLARNIGKLMPRNAADQVAEIVLSMHRSNS